MSTCRLNVERIINPPKASWVVFIYTKHTLQMPLYELKISTNYISEFNDFCSDHALKLHGDNPPLGLACPDRLQSRVTLVTPPIAPPSRLGIVHSRRFQEIFQMKVFQLRSECMVISLGKS